MKIQLYNHYLTGILSIIEVFCAKRPSWNFTFRVCCRRLCEMGELGAAGVQEVLFLESTSMLRKYSSFLDAAWTSVTHRYKGKALPCLCMCAYWNFTSWQHRSKQLGYALTHTSSQRIWVHTFIPRVCICMYMKNPVRSTTEHRKKERERKRKKTLYTSWQHCSKQLGYPLAHTCTCIYIL